MSEVQQSVEEIKSVPFPTLSPEEVQALTDEINKLPTLYGRGIINWIEKVALDQYRKSQEFKES